MRYLLLLLMAATLFFSCNNFGDKISQGYLEVYYVDGISKETAERTLQFLYPQWQNADGSETAKKSVQLSQSGDTILFRMVADMKKVNEIGDHVFHSMAHTLSDSLFQHAPVSIVFTDKKFKTLQVLPFKKQPDFGELAISGNIEVYIKNGRTASEAARLEQFMTEFFGTEKQVGVQLSEDEGGVILVKMVYNKEYAATVPDEDFADIAARISAEVFNNAPVILSLTDAYFKSYKSYPHGTKALTEQ